MKRIILSKIKVKGTRGYKYFLRCNTCKGEFSLGGNNFNKGRGYFCSPKCRANHPEERKKNSERLKLGYKNGRKHPRGMLGKPAWNKGLECPRWKKENNPNWNGGSSFGEYGLEFDYTLKRKIRRRDTWTCQDCKTKKGEMIVHHIDYDKKNNRENNLITLCRSCHSKTNFNRENWTSYFKKKMKCMFKE